ncbi:helix-turn-helix domain-containing protein [Geodermatophilus sp. SYSU D01176]
MRTYGLGKGAVLRLLDIHGVTRRRQGLPPFEVQEALRLYGQGWSLARIGERFGRHHSVILRALERAGMPRRDQHRRPHSQPGA